MKKKFTDKWVRSVRPAPQGKRVEYWDAVVPCFGLRVTDLSHKTFVLYTRWPGSRSPTRREIGNADKLPLADARQVAREWLRQVELGIDPHQQRRSEAAAREKAEQHRFGPVAEAWLREPVARMAKKDEIERAVRHEFASLWDRPISAVTTLEVRNIIKNKALGLSPAPNAKKRGPAQAQARNLLGYVKQLFNWAVGQHAYGLDKSPAEPLKGDDLTGKKRRRKRVLSDDELRVVWRAAEETPYPYGPLFRMLVLTGQRRSEVAEARWSELNMRKKLWIIPAERMKMDDAHVVPLTEDMIALLNELPRFNTGNHLFSTTFGERPANGFSKAKERIGEIVGDMPHWVIHDLRRTMRTNLSALQITDRVRELMIAHAQPGLHQVYDQYSYLEEKRAGFGLWHERLRGILAASSEKSNVISLVTKM